MEINENMLCDCISYLKFSDNFEINCCFLTGMALDIFNVCLALWTVCCENFCLQEVCMINSESEHAKCLICQDFYWDCLWCPHCCFTFFFLFSTWELRQSHSRSFQLQSPDLSLHFWVFQHMWLKTFFKFCIISEPSGTDTELHSGPTIISVKDSRTSCLAHLSKGFLLESCTMQKHITHGSYGQ